MARFKVEIAYDGSDFFGWQKQSELRTVQGEIETLLSKINNTQTTIYASGRTDAKVHALGQVFHFDSELKMKSNDWHRVLDRMLSEDIRVWSVESVSESFHSRYDATSKRYIYKISQSEMNIFMRHYKCFIEEELDIIKMKEAAEIFIGTHDFSSFNSTKIEEIENQVRTIYDIAFHRRQEELHIEFHGNGFLRYMVRMLTAAIIEAGKSNIEVEELEKILKQKEKGIWHLKAPAHGLYLFDVKY